MARKPKPDDTPSGEDRLKAAAPAANQAEPVSAAGTEPAAPAGVESATPATSSGLQVTVTGPKRGRRRIGRQFGRDPVVIPFDDLTEAEREALADDPLLMVAISPAPIAETE